MQKLKGEYKGKGKYHQELDRNWKYLPVYLEKMKAIEGILRKFPQKKILDAGCGEGILVEKYRKKGFDIAGFDLNYSSKFVKTGDIRAIPFKNQEFGLVLCLDVLEHINLSDQEKAIDELIRVTKDKGVIIFSLPNLAHFISRISFLLTGNLLRTSAAERHIGDRPINEFINLLRQKKLIIRQRIGLFPTFPLISLSTKYHPSSSILWHRIYNKIFRFPGLCFENILITNKLAQSYG